MLFKYALRDFPDWSPAVKGLLLALVASLLLALAWTLDLGEQFAHYTDARAKRLGVEARLAAARRQQHRLPVLERRFQSRRRTLFPGVACDASGGVPVTLLRQLSQHLEASGLTLLNLTPAPVRKQDGVLRWPLAVSVTGAQPALLDFLRGLSASATPLTLRNFELTQGRADGSALHFELNAQFSGFCFPWQTPAASPRSSTRTAAFAPSPPAPAPPTPARSPELATTLARYPVGQLRMTGFLKQMASDGTVVRIWGLVTAPNGHVFRLAPGERAGAEQARVTAIDAKQISLALEDETGRKKRLSIPRSAPPPGGHKP